MAARSKTAFQVCPIGSNLLLRGISDSGIGRAIAIAFAREGADLLIA